VKSYLMAVGMPFALVIAVGCGAGDEGQVDLAGDYLDQTPPGQEPVIFAPGIVSTEANELNCVFTPDGNELFFSVWVSGQNTLTTIRRENGTWTARSSVPFSGTYSDVDPFVTADGQQLYFSSSRPLEGAGDAKDSDLWYVTRKASGGWGDPVHLGSPNTPGADDYYTSITDKGTLYSSIFREHGSSGDLYRAELKDGEYGAPELLPEPINTEASEHDPYISRDGSFLIFTSDRPGGLGRGDLYVSFRKPDGTWGEPSNMGEPINSDGYDFCAMLSPDGKYLFFTRNIEGNGDIYWVDAGVIETMRSRALDEEPQ
jgi:Tol biopolymer transport system component